MSGRRPPVRFGLFVPQGWILDLIDIRDPVERFETRPGLARLDDVERIAAEVLPAFLPG